MQNLWILASVRVGPATATLLAICFAVGWGSTRVSAKVELNRVADDLLQLTRQFHRYLTQGMIDTERNNATC